MRDLIAHPAWRPEDLGFPLPDSPHAVSVAMPLWEHVVGYEEEDPAVTDRLRCGYPRFFCHPTVRRLFKEAESRAARSGERALVFPNADIARRCLEFVSAHAGQPGRVAQPWPDLALGAAMIPDGSAWRAALHFWRVAGEIISSRTAEAALSGENTRTSAQPVSGPDPRRALRERIANFCGQSPEDVFLFGTGMAATFTVYRMVTAFRPDAPCLQLEFPYVDVLKVQQEFGSRECQFFPVVTEDALPDVERALRAEDFRGVFCELASNPLMRSVDLERLAPIIRSRDVPLVIDDTVATVVNADVFRFADVVTASLTKYFAGTGDVMGGSVVVNAASPFAAQFRAWLNAEGGTAGPLAEADAAILEGASRDFAERVQQINTNAECLFDTLRRHPKVGRVYYAKGETPAWFDQIRRPNGGWGGLLSLTLRHESDAPRFYDRLRISKGPSFGTNFTLACPYTLLAHYRELEWAERCGVSRSLIRVGVGLEDPDDLARRFREALDG